MLLTQSLRLHHLQAILRVNYTMLFTLQSVCLFGKQVGFLNIIVPLRQKIIINFHIL